MESNENWLKKRRADLAISQEELTSKLQVMGFDVSRTTVSGWETGRFYPPIDNPAFRAALATILHLTISEMLVLAGYEIDVEHTPEGSRAASIVDRLPPLQKKYALQLLKLFEDIINAF
jgi:transcriptional regulator with XRE-family HTH domain